MFVISAMLTCWWPTGASAQTAMAQELWSHGEFQNYPSSGALLQAINDAHTEWFGACMSRGAALPAGTGYQCSKLSMSGIRPPQSPGPKYNDAYMYFSVNATWHTEGMNNGQSFSYDRDANDNYGVNRNLVCPTKHGYNEHLVTRGTNDFTLSCANYKLPPLQCDTCVIGKPKGTGAPGTMGNPMTMVGPAGPKKVDRHVDYVSSTGTLRLVREFKGQNSGWYFPGNSLLAETVVYGASPPLLSQLFQQTFQLESGSTVSRTSPLDSP